MENIDLVEKSKIMNFLSACDELINGKFILAEVKIIKILNLIADCEPLYRYIQECMIDFNFEREYSKAEVKNRFNNNHFIAPQEVNKLVALVYSLFVGFENKQIDFYSFVNNNFVTLNEGAEYDLFVNTLVVPFRNILAKQFDLGEKAFNKNTQNEVVEDEQESLEEKDEIEQIWDNVSTLVDSLVNTVLFERKVKKDAKENILYILKSIKYSSKYKDMRIVSSFLLSLEMLLKKVNSTKIVLNEIKTEIGKYYELVAQKAQS